MEYTSYLDISVFHKAKQPIRRPNPCDNRTLCPHMCVLSPLNSPQDYRCISDEFEDPRNDDFDQSGAKVTSGERGKDGVELKNTTENKAIQVSIGNHGRITKADEAKPFPYIYVSINCLAIAILSVGLFICCVIINCGQSQVPASGEWSFTRKNCFIWFLPYITTTQILKYVPKHFKID